MDKNIYNIALVVHIVGITIMAGATFIDFMTFRKFWKVLPSNKQAGLTIADFLYGLQRFLGIGMLVIILSGVGMMIYMHQIWGQQTWFRVKFGILILIIINGLAIRRRLGNNLKKNLADETGVDRTLELTNLKRKISLGHLFQIVFFIAIYILSVFKFN